MAAAWEEYQEKAAIFYRSLGMAAETNVRLQGARTGHLVDVLVKSHHVGFAVTWIVECKCWQTPVNKLHVLALREIVADTGADRGILLSESGFQAGAKEAATLTNVHLQSLAESEAAASADVAAMRLADLNDRAQKCKHLYWELPKALRIEHGLRPDGGGAMGYSGNSVISLAEATLLKAFNRTYPFAVDPLWRAASFRFPEMLTSAEDAAVFPEVMNSPEQVVTYLEPLVAELERKLVACVTALPPDHPLRAGSLAKLADLLHGT